jgi:hypothetical protein
MMGDGVPEIITCTRGGSMRGAFVYNNKGNRIAHLASCAASSAGPNVANVGPDRPLLLLPTICAYMIRVDGKIVSGTVDPGGP